MIWDIVYVLAGLALLVTGGEWLVRGAYALALRARVSPTVAGLTIVAAGTSMPELIVSARSALGGAPEMAVGNVIGSNIFNLAVILGLVACLRPPRVQSSAVRLEWPVMFAATIAVAALAWQGSVSRVAGALLTLGLVGFTLVLLRFTRRPDAPVEPSTPSTGSALAACAWVALGIAALAGGSEFLVRGASSLAESAGVSEAVIGLTIIGAGTSTPELAASLVAARRGHSDIAVANVLGSNIFNLLGIVGVTALITPLPVAPVLAERDMVWLGAITLATLPILWSGMRISRLEGVGLLAAYAAYLTVLLVA